MLMAAVYKHPCWKFLAGKAAHCHLQLWKVSAMGI